ncbi:glycoside hydrolase family 5 protein [Phlebopus sp. FC_14]|nr:glycoside hydrolase family 5 protein [Phlebopus sp. FC_14]
MSSDRHGHPTPYLEESNSEVVYRYRRQRGVNLGSWFVLERWITDAPFRFAAAPGQSDLDVAKGSHAKEILEQHWDTWITANDFEWLASKGINAVRIPIGYYHICGLDDSILNNTDFQGLEDVFSGAWVRLANAVETAQRFGIGVLIDLHSAPGKQNQDSHSGTSSPRVSLFESRSNLKLTIWVLRILVEALRSLRSECKPPLYNIIGVELLNEPKPQSHSALQDWYAKAIGEIRSVYPGLPIYVSDCWIPDSYADFVKKLPSSAIPTCLDHHLYRCFTGSDISTSAAQHSAALTDPNAQTPLTFARVASQLEDAGGGLMVGEWSGALNPGSLQGPINEWQERKCYISAQLQLFERHCTGWFFWTYKKEQPGDQGWSFRDAVEAGVFPAFVGLCPTKSIYEDSDKAARKNGSQAHAAGQHASYWAQYPGHYEHWRFEKGYNQGWEDAYRFFLDKDATAFAVPELGFKGSWKKKRAQGHVIECGSSGSIWEYGE